jgi:L-malate glycosyltransferase
MRIAFVYDALYPWVKGGAERRFHELGQRLSKRHEVHFLSWQWWEGPRVVERDGVTLHGVGTPPDFYGVDGRRTVREALTYSARLAPVLARGRWDVIDCSATPFIPLYATWVVARMTRTPLVVTWHEFWGKHWHEYMPDRPAVATVARVLESFGRRLGDRVVAVSDFTAERIAKSGDGRLTVVGNGVTLGGHRVARQVSAPEVVYVGRLIDEKRVDLLVDAVALLADRLPKLRCAIVGSGPQLASLQDRVASQGLRDRVHFRAGLSDAAVREAIAAAKVLVLPSLREGFGMTVAEAQAFGTVPVVVRSPHSAAPSLVRHGLDGLIVAPSAEGVAQGIAEVLGDRARQQRMSRHARQAGRLRDWDALAVRMERVYAG